MRNIIVSSLVLSLTIFSVQNGFAQNTPISNDLVQSRSNDGGDYQNSRWANYSTNEKVMLDRIAADFYQSSLRLSQSRKIEAATVGIYLAKSPEERSAFRENRRNVWRTMSEDQRRSSRNVKFPVYSNLTPEQKTPFRQIALDQLAPASASHKTKDTVAYSSGGI